MKCSLAFLPCLLFCGQLWGDPGNWFLVTFPQGLEVNKTPSSGFTLMALGDGVVSVDMATPPSAPSPLSHTLILQPETSSSYLLDDLSKILPVGTFLTDMTIQIIASDRISLEVVNNILSNGDAFSPIPVNQLGTDYLAAAGTKNHHHTASFVTVSAPYDDTQVTLTFPQRHRDASSDMLAKTERFVLQGVTYFYNDVVTFTLGRLQTMQLQSSLDLTGTHVTSSRPVAVLSGQNRTNLSGKGCRSHLLEQMPPTSHWAYTFILVHVPNQTAGDHYRFVAKDPMTTVTLKGGAQTLKIQEAGGFVEYDLQDGELVFAQADKPVMAVQYTREQLHPFMDTPGDPAMLVLSPWEHALDVYHIVTEKSHMDTYAVITMKALEAGPVKLNGQARVVTWRFLTGSADHVVGHVKLEVNDLPCKLGESGGPLMNVHVYHVMKCECWAMSLTHGSPVNQSQEHQSNCSPSRQIAGDGIDNDCDDIIDEEPCYVNVGPQDTDGDQYTNEDCARQDEPTCLDSSGVVYPCHELYKWSYFTEIPDSRRRADVVIPVSGHTVSKITCAVTCARKAGCWGINFDYQGGEDHQCELLLGWGRGLVEAQGWGFESMKSFTVFSS